MPRFRFRDYPLFTDGEIDVVIEHRRSGDPLKNWLPAYIFAISLHGSTNSIGTVSLRVGYTDDVVWYGGHIGYEIVPRMRGRHFAAKACLLILPVIVDHGLDVVWITCNPDNWASRRTCERIGCEFVEIVDLPPDNDMYQDGERQKCRYRWVIYGADDSSRNKTSV